MNNFCAMISPEEAIRGGDSRPLIALYLLASVAPHRCQCCLHSPAWRYAGLGLCFSCVTDEDDASSDHELLFREWTWPYAEAVITDDNPLAGSDAWMIRRGYEWRTVRLWGRWVHRRTGAFIEKLPHWDNEQWRQHKIDRVLQKAPASVLARPRQQTSRILPSNALRDRPMAFATA